MDTVAAELAFAVKAKPVISAPPASVIFKSLPLTKETLILLVRVSSQVVASLAFKVARILVCKATAKSVMGELLRLSLSKEMVPAVG